MTATYEYKVLTLTSYPHEYHMNILGKKGWRMIQLTPYDKDGFVYLYLIRNMETA